MRIEEMRGGAGRQAEDLVLSLRADTAAGRVPRTGRGPAIIAVNPDSLLAGKMVKEGFGVAGDDARAFASPHPDVLDPGKNATLVAAIEDLLAVNP